MSPSDKGYSQPPTPPRRARTGLGPLGWTLRFERNCSDWASYRETKAYRRVSDTHHTAEEYLHKGIRRYLSHYRLPSASLLFAFARQPFAASFEKSPRADATCTRDRIEQHLTLTPPTRLTGSESLDLKLQGSERRLRRP